MTNSNFITILHSHGLIAASVNFNDLPPDVQQKLQQCTHLDCTDQFINLIANGGSSFWTQLDLSEFKKKPNPVDEFSHALAEQLIATSNTAEQCSILYPSTQPVPLMQLGKLVGWSLPSPLGLGLHPSYGPWFAYRAVIMSAQPLQTELTPITDNTKQDALFGSDCINCAAPCVTACPANAVSQSSTFNIEHCAGYRLQRNSGCGDTCHARYACPVGQQHQYSDAQTAHHMGRSLVTLANWFRASEPR
jgi:ferredoxin